MDRFMKTIDFPKFKDYTNQIVRYIQPKFDGHLTKIYFPGKNVIDGSSLYALTKNDKDITEKLLAIGHIRKELGNLPCDSIIFAELHCPGRFATDVPTMLNDSNSDLRLTAFAAPVFNGHGRDYAMDLIEVMSWLKDCGLEIPGTELIHPRREINLHRQKRLLEQAKKLKLEGWVLKEGHLYGWYKLKPTKTIDVVVIGVYQSFSVTNYGGLKAIHVGIYKPNGKWHDLGHVGSGFSLPYRKSLDTDAKRETLIGRVCVIEYDSLAAKGKLKFPRMAKNDNDEIIWRTDKDPKQCTTEQLES